MYPKTWRTLIQSTRDCHVKFQKCLLINNFWHLVVNVAGMQFASDLDYLDMSNSPRPQLRSQLVFKVPWRWVAFLTFILKPVVPPEQLPSKKIAQFLVICHQNIISPVYNEPTFLSTSNKLVKINKNWWEDVTKISVLVSFLHTLDLDPSVNSLGQCFCS